MSKYIYDAKSNTMKITRVDFEEPDTDLLTDMKMSYKAYLSNGIIDGMKPEDVYPSIQEDMEYLKDTIVSEGIVSDLQVKTKVGNLCSLYSLNEKSSSNVMWLPVDVEFIVNGISIGEYNIFRIPTIDQYCVLNVDGAQKTLMNELVSSEDVTFSHDKHGKSNTLILNFPNGNSISIEVRDRGILFKLWGNKIEAEKLLTAMTNDLPNDYFTNEIITAVFNLSPNRLYSLNEAQLEKSRILERLQSKYFKLGCLRDALNKKLSLDRALGKTLSRPVGGTGILFEKGHVLTQEDVDLLLSKHIEIVHLQMSETFISPFATDNSVGFPLSESIYDTDVLYPAGTVVDTSVLETLKRNFINEVYIEHVPKLNKKFLAERIKIKRLPMGTKITTMFQSLTGLYKDTVYTVTKEDVDVDIELMAGDQLTPELVQLLYDAGIRSVKTFKTKNSYEIIEYKFEQEIISNKTVQVKDFRKGTDDLAPEDWIYYGDGTDPTTVEKSNCPDLLTAWDVAALISLAARVRTMPELLDSVSREMDLKKRVNLIGNIFSLRLRKVIDTIIKTEKPKVASFLLGRSKNNPFYGVTAAWRTLLLKETLLRPSGDKSPAVMIEQARKVLTPVKDKHAVSDDQRGLSLAMMYKLCPYDIPAGMNIGLVNTLASGCRIHNGIMYAPYRKVQRTSKGYIVSSKVRYMSFEDEQHYILGDLDSLSIDKDGYIENTDIIARVPSPTDNFEKMKVVKVSSWNIEYVNAYGEQYLSPVAQVIPFLLMNDSIRITYGINQMSAMIYLQNGERARVETSMYRHIFDHSTDYVIKAEDDGEVIEIGVDTLIVKYNNQKEMSVIKIKETKYLNEAVISMNYKVCEGEHFSKGDILIDSPVSRGGHLVTGINPLTAYVIYKGWNYEDSVAVSEELTPKMTSISSHEERKPLSYSKGIAIPLDTNLYSYISGGAVIAPIEYKNGSDLEVDNIEEWCSAKHGNKEGILYSLQADTKKTKYNATPEVVAKLLNYKKLKESDKVSGRHGNKGTIGKVVPNSEMPTLLNGMRIELLQNPLGVPSRMNFGQMSDVPLSLAAVVLDTYFESNSCTGATTEDVKYFMNYAYDVANEYDLTEESDFLALVKKYDEIPYSFHCKVRRGYDKVKEWEGAFLPNGEAYIYDPVLGKVLENPVQIGFPYYLKMVQEGDEKQGSRSGPLFENYTAKEHSPTKGGSRGGGQKNGEMEFAALEARGASNYVYEICNHKSDNVGLRMNEYARALGYNKDIVNLKDCAPYTAYMSRYYLESLGINTIITDYPGIDRKSVSNVFNFDGKELLTDLTVGKEKYNKEIIKETKKRLGGL